jgi:hypothetical protein
VEDGRIGNEDGMRFLQFIHSLFSQKMPEGMRFLSIHSLAVFSNNAGRGCGQIFLVCARASLQSQIVFMPRSTVAQSKPTLGFHMKTDESMKQFK